MLPIPLIFPEYFGDIKVFFTGDCGSEIAQCSHTSNHTGRVVFKVFGPALAA